jgi:hypothetical protein
MMLYKLFDTAVQPRPLHRGPQFLCAGQIRR